MGEPLIVDLFVASAIPVVKILLICGIGAFCARKGLLTPEGRRVLGALSFLVFNPALIFVKLSSTLTPARLLHWWPLVLNTGISTAVGLGLGYLGAHMVGIRRGHHLRPHTVVAIALGNLGNLPLVIVSTLAASSAEVLHGIPPGRAEDLAVSYVMVGLLIPCIAHATIGFSMLRKHDPAVSPPELPEPLGPTFSARSDSSDACEGVALITAQQGGGPQHQLAQHKHDLLPLMPTPASVADPRVVSRSVMGGEAQLSLRVDGRSQGGLGRLAPAAAPAGGRHAAPRGGDGAQDRAPLLGGDSGGETSGLGSGSSEGSADGDEAAAAAAPASMAAAAPASMAPAAAPDAGARRGQAQCGAHQARRGGAETGPHMALELPSVAAAGDRSAPSKASAACAAGVPYPDAADAAAVRFGCGSGPPDSLSRLPSARRPHAAASALRSLARHVWKEATSPPLLAILLSVPVGCIAPLKRAFFGGGGGGGAAPLGLITDCLAMLGDCTVPAILVILGATLANGPGAARVPLRITALVNSTRLALLPLLGMALVMGAYAARAFEAPDPIYLLVLLIQNTAPTAIMVHTMASVQQNRSEEVSTILFWGYMAGILVIPLWLTLFLYVVKESYRDTH